MFDYYAQKRYLTELRRKNEIVGRRLEEVQVRKEREETEREKALEKVSRKIEREMKIEGERFCSLQLRMETELRRQHHMLSTECVSLSHTQKTSLILLSHNGFFQREGVYKPFREGR